MIFQPQAGFDEAMLVLQSQGLSHNDLDLFCLFAVNFHAFRAMFDL